MDESPIRRAGIIVALAMVCAITGATMVIGLLYAVMRTNHAQDLKIGSHNTRCIDDNCKLNP